MRIVWLFALLFLSRVALTQNLSEWANQKQTRKKYLLEQIAALKVYLDYGRKGYSIVSGGLRTISDIKKGDFKLHNSFFNSLRDVNPQVQKWERVSDIISLQIQIVKQSKIARGYVRQSGELTEDELTYCIKVLDALVNECVKDLDALTDIITPGKIEMKEDERILSIEHIYLNIRDRYSFLSSFSRDLHLLCIQRKEEQIQIQTSEILSK